MSFPSFLPLIMLCRLFRLFLFFVIYHIDIVSILCLLFFFLPFPYLSFVFILLSLSLLTFLSFAALFVFRNVHGVSYGFYHTSYTRLPHNCFLFTCRFTKFASFIHFIVVHQLKDNHAFSFQNHVPSSRCCRFIQLLSFFNTFFRFIIYRITDPFSATCLFLEIIMTLKHIMSFSRVKL